MYTDRVVPNAYLILPASSNSTLDVYEVSWNVTSNTGSINVLYTTIDLIEGQQVHTFTDFAVVEDRLFVVLINEIWVYTIKNNQATRLYVINQAIKTVGEFHP